MKGIFRNRQNAILISFCLLWGWAAAPVFGAVAADSGESVTPVVVAAGESKKEQRNSFHQQDTIGRSRPFQMQFQVSGAGRGRDRSANPAVSLHLGYRFSGLMYLGLTSQTFYNDNSLLNEDEDYRYDDERVYGQEGVHKTTVRNDPRHLLEMRFFPWSFGLYFSAGLMHVGAEKVVTEFKSRPRVINENEYDTALTTTLEYQAWTGAAAGIGFQHIFRNGFSLGGGLNLGLGIRSPEVSIESEAAIAAADLEAWQEQIETNEIRIPVMFNIGVGYAF